MEEQYKENQKDIDNIFLPKIETKRNTQIKNTYSVSQYKK